MRDVNNILRRLYYTALSGHIVVNGATVPVYDKFVPTDQDILTYVLINPFSSKDLSTKQTSDTDTSVQFRITKKFAGNVSSADIDAIAQSIYYLTDNIQSAEIQIFNRQLVNDIEIAGSDSTQASTSGTNQYKTLERVLTFKHKIFHKQ